MLEGQGHSVLRKGKEKPAASQQPMADSATGMPTVRDVASGVRLYCEHLERYSGNRPASETTLRNSIRTRMGQNLTMTEAVLEQLIKLKALSFNGSKVVYQSTKIGQLARMTV